MKKKLLCIITLILALLCIFVSCKNDEPSKNDGPSKNDENDKNDVTTTETQHVHTEVIDKAVAPTNTEDGLTEGKHCSVCGEITVEQEGVPALGTSGLAYEVNADGKTCTIVGIGTCTDSVICIGNYINEYKVIAIGAGAFSDCGNITEIKFAANSTITSIGEEAFYKCSSLTSITLPDSVTTLGSFAFYNCTKLSEVTLGTSLRDIVNGAFEYCSSLTSIVVDSGNTVYHSDGNCLIETASKTLISGCKNSIIPIDGSVTGIGSGAFYGCSSLTSITIPDSVTSIGNWAFEWCSSLTNITIPDSVTSIGLGAFNGCSSLTSITLPFVGATKDGTTSTRFRYIFDVPTSLGNSGCVPTSLKTVVITGGTSICDYAFNDCSSLTSITIPDSVTSIGERAFYGCRNLTSITIPDRVTSIGIYAFYGCGLIQKEKGVSYVDKWVIDCDTSVTSVTLRENTVGIGDYAFSGCSSLTSITIPDRVTSISYHAFWSCSSLTSITIPDSVTSIGFEAFYRCISLRSITISDSVTSINYGAFDGCFNLTDVYYTGNEEDWRQIEIGSSNSYLTNATIHYNYVP